MNQSKSLRVYCDLKNSLLPSINELESNYDPNYGLKYMLSFYPFLEDLSIEVDTYLDISVSGCKELANCIRELTNLKYLSLRIQWANQIGSGGDYIGEALGHLTNLIELKLQIDHVNRLYSKGFLSFTNAISKLINLEKLDLTIGKNNIYTKGAAGLGVALKNLSKLKELSLKLMKNKFIDTVATRSIADSFQSFVNLEKLTLFIDEYVHDTEATIFLFGGLQYLNKLKYFDLTVKFFTYQQETVAIFNGISKLTQLEYLNIYFGYGVTMASINQIENFDQYFQNLINLKFFKIICFSNYSKSEVYFGKFITFLPNLQHLEYTIPYVHEFNLECTVEFIDKLKTLSNLETLYLSFKSQKNDNIYEQLGKQIQNLTKLRKLNLKLQKAGKIEDNFEFLQIGEGLRHLQKLEELSFNLKIYDYQQQLDVSSMWNDIKELVNLKKLKLKYFSIKPLSQVQLETLFNLIQPLKQLARLDLLIPALNQISQQNLLCLSHNLTKLEHLSYLRIMLHQKHDTKESLDFCKQLLQIQSLKTLRILNLYHQNKPVVKRILIRKMTKLVNIQIV